MAIFAGQTVLITGGARGIGLALCEAFLQEGANVSFCATSDESINKAKEHLKNYDANKILALKADISKQEDCTDLVNKTLEQFKQIDVLINNAGITRDNLLIRMKEEDFEKVIDINLKGKLLAKVGMLMAKSSLRGVKRSTDPDIAGGAPLLGVNGNVIISHGKSNEKAIYHAIKAGIKTVESKALKAMEQAIADHKAVFDEAEGK